MYNNYYVNGFVTTGRAISSGQYLPEIANVGGGQVKNTGGSKQT